MHVQTLSFMQIWNQFIIVKFILVMLKIKLFYKQTITHEYFMYLKFTSSAIESVTSEI